MAAEASSSNVSVMIPMGPQVFLSFRGIDVRKGFISFLVPALKEKGINVFIDEEEERGKHLTNLFVRISESKLVLVIFSERYTESKWCMDELVHIKAFMDQNKLIVIPIFYKIDPTKVKRLRGDFGDHFRDLVDKYKHANPGISLKWTEALSSVCKTFAMYLPENSDTSDKDFVMSIVKEVKRVLLPNNSKGKDVEIGENQEGLLVTTTRKLTITTTIHESSPNNEEAVEVSVLKEVYWVSNVSVNIQITNHQSPAPAGPSHEFKFWDMNKPKSSVMINARELSIVWSNDPNYWAWFPFPNSTPTVEIAVLRNVCWLNVAGKFDTRHLCPWTRYEVVFVVAMMKTTAQWKAPVKLKLVLPSSSQERSMDMKTCITKKWFDIPIGEFTTSMDNIGEISFAMYEHESKRWKSGLFVKGAEIRPKN